MTEEFEGAVPFQAHIELLQLFIARREALVDAIQGLLNAQYKPTAYLQDRPALAQALEEAFFGLEEVSDAQRRLRGQLLATHWASGFRPREIPGLHNEIVDPAEMMIRAFYCWQQTRWPGKKARVSAAAVVFDLYLLRCLELLSMRLWDDEPSTAPARLAQVQAVLDALVKTTPGDLPVMVRDARWLIPLTQSPTTDDLAAYFRLAERIAETLGADDRLVMQKTHVRMLGGHLTSQIRHYCLRDGVSLDEASVLRRTRTSNALDFGLLVQKLVALFDAYERARVSGDEGRRLELAGAILQGISPDPEVFVNRVDLLGAYSMIEAVFVAPDSQGQAAYTPLGQRHLRLFEEYKAKLGPLVQSLYRDCVHFRPADGKYSAFGAIFGTPSHLIENISLKALVGNSVTQFGLEDILADGDADKLAWVNGWRKLPHVKHEVQKLHRYPQAFATAIYERIERELHRHISGAAKEIPKTGQLFVECGEASQPDAVVSPIPDLPLRYIDSSDEAVVYARRANPCDEAQLLHERTEGHYIVSFRTPGGWTGVRKDLLTEVIGAGGDARIAGLPEEAARLLALMCPGMVRLRA